MPCRSTSKMTSGAWDLLTQSQKDSMSLLVDQINRHRAKQRSTGTTSAASSVSSVSAATTSTKYKWTDMTQAAMSQAVESARANAGVGVTPGLIAVTMPDSDRLDAVYIKVQRDLAFTELRSQARFVPGVGPRPPKVMLIGEAPGAEEDKLGEPFVGKSGNFLSSMMAYAGLKRADCFITNVVHYRPPNNRTPSREEVESAVPHLRRELMAILPNGGVVVLLGSVALNIVDQGKKISRVHGDPFKKGAWTFMPLWHPSYVMQNRAPRDEYVEDWRELGELLNGQA